MEENHEEVASLRLRRHRRVGSHGFRGGVCAATCCQSDQRQSGAGGREADSQGGCQDRAGRSADRSGLPVRSQVEQGVPGVPGNIPCPSDHRAGRRVHPVQLR